MSVIRLVALGAAALLAGPLTVWGTTEFARPPIDKAYTAPGLDPIPAQEALGEFFTLLPALLMVVYDAFGRTDEEEIYDTLAIAAHGEALEALYLERAGAMAGGGLTESDQTIHEMTLKSAAARQSGRAFTVDATWQVIGTVGHSEHLHVRGNTYSATLSIAPVGDAWKIVEFALTDVNRDTAGEMIEANPS